MVSLTELLALALVAAPCGAATSPAAAGTLLALALTAVPSAGAASASPGGALLAGSWRADAATSSEAPSSAWPRGGRRACGTLRTPGASFGGRFDETDHCFPANAADHFVCCVAIQSVSNALNDGDASVARHNPLEGPITRNSDASSYSWCVCSETICTRQLNGTVAWVGRPGDT